MKASVQELEVFFLNSRVISAVYYHTPTRRMVIQTAHRKFLVYSDIDGNVAHALSEHPAPGVFFEQTLKPALKPKLASKLSLSSMLLIRRLRALGGAERNDSELLDFVE